MAIAATYISPSSFSVVGNQLTEFHAGRRVEMVGNTLWTGTIAISGFTTVTEVILTDGSDDIDNTLTTVQFGIVGAGGHDSSMPIHTHDGDEGQGGQLDHKDMSNIGNNTHEEIDGAITSSTSHIADTDNPHETTKAHVGLSDVPNTDFTNPVSLNTTHRSSNGNDHSNVVLNNSHRQGDGSDHSDVALNSTHRTSDGKDHSDVVLNNAHRVSDGTDHSDVVLANTHRGTTTGNPHNVSLSDVGGTTDHTQLSNIGTWSHADLDIIAQNGEDHIADVTDNPHEVDKADVGLSNVPNTDFTVPVGNNTTHSTGDGSDHADVASNTVHRSSNGNSHSNVVLNNTHRTSDGKDHSDVVANTAANALDLTHRTGNGTDHSQVATNKTHVDGDGSDHADVATNTIHSTGDGSDHSEVALNITHRSSNGTDHGYINQDVQSTASPTFNKVQYTPQSGPSHNEGLTFYDSDKQALSYYNNESDITVNMGQEIMFRVVNTTGEIVPNGTVVYPSGVDSTTGLPTFGLADASVTAKSRLYGLATHEIGIGETGFVTRLGEVGGLNTLGLSGAIYVSATTPGAYTMTPPDDGAYISIIGAIGKVHETEGTIVVDPQPSHDTVEINDQNGFPNRTSTTLSFSDSTPDRTFYITPAVDDFHFYELGNKYEKEAEESIQIDNTEGYHIIYYDEGVLTAIANPNDGQIDVAIRTKALIAYVYWDATNSIHTYFGDERHGISMAPVTHSYLHFTRGAQYLNGLSLGDFDADSTTDPDRAQFSVASGSVADEDIVINSPAVDSTTGLPIYYLDGANGDLRRTTQAGFSVKAGTGTGNPLWNNPDGGGVGIWGTTEVGNNDYVLYHIFAINGYTGKDQVVSVMGQDEYGTVGQARAGASTEISNILIGFPFQETIPLGSIIFQANTSYANDVNARVRTNDEGDDYVDWRTTELAQGTAPSSHANLTDLQLAGTTVTWGHIDDQSQSIYGEKTFNTFPITPSAAPDADYEVANKKYVDDASGGLPITTKGDLVGYDTAANRIPVGTTGQVLKVDPAEALGVKWGDESGGESDHDQLNNLDYASAGHTGFEASIGAKGTAFNDNYGTGSGEVCQGNDSRLSDTRDPNAHTIAFHDTSATGAELDELTDGSDTTLHDHAGISENTAARHAESHNIASHNDTTTTGTELDELSGAGDTSLHYHSADRSRTNHTGTQTSSTISDFDASVSANSDVTANTAKVTNSSHTGDVTGSAALTIGLNKVNDTHIDWGTGANQVSQDDVVDGSTYVQTENNLTDTLAGNITTNNAKVTNATHTGEVTGSGALTVVDNVIDEANLKITGGSNGQVLTKDDGEAGGYKWDDAGGGSIPTGVDETIVRYDGTDNVQDSGITISDTDDVVLPATSSLSCPEKLVIPLNEPTSLSNGCIWIV